MRKLSEKQLTRRTEVLARLKLNNGNLARTSRESGVTRATIRAWRDANAVEAEKLRRKKERAEKEQAAIAAAAEQVVELSREKLEELAVELVASLLTDLKDKRLKMPFRDRAWTFAVLFDKLQVMKGLPTAINKTVGSLTDEQRAERARALIERGRQRRLNKGGQPMGIVGDD